MEVHHHPHVEKKSFKEYLLEGLMIFLAVTLGFIAENIRESIVEHEIVKRNMEIIVGNLKTDIESLNTIIDFNQNRVVMLDSLIAYKHKDLRNPHVLSGFGENWLKAVILYTFNSNNSTYEQMKSSGSLRFARPG